MQQTYFFLIGLGILIIFYAGGLVWKSCDQICVPSAQVKIVIFVPCASADAVRDALAKAGAGKIGHYEACSFSSQGKGRWIPGQGARPMQGHVGAYAEAMEERIEALCPQKKLRAVIAAVKKVHPYEQMGYDIYPLLELSGEPI